MSQIDFFKRQAKNLNSDIKTQFFNEQEGIFEYKPRFFDINNIIIEFELDERDPKFKSLGKAQWIIAIILGLRYWDVLVHSDPVSLELYKLMFEHQDEITPDEWEGMFVLRTSEGEISVLEEPLDKLEHFKVLLEMAEKNLISRDFGNSYLIPKKLNQN